MLFLVNRQKVIAVLCLQKEITKRLIKTDLMSTCCPMYAMCIPVSTYNNNRCFTTFSRSTIQQTSIKRSSYPNNYDHILSQHVRTTNDRRLCSTQKEEPSEPNLTLFQKFKQMYKQYWYVLLPVHIVTSSIWFGCFYYVAKSGVDIVAILESIGAPEKVCNSFKDSSMGYIAVAYGLYKLATPARYTVTVGGTTIAINYLKKSGYIKPVPSTEKLKEMYQTKKENIIQTVKETKGAARIRSMAQRRQKLKKKKNNHKNHNNNKSNTNNSDSKDSTTKKS